MCFYIPLRVVSVGGKGFPFITLEEFLESYYWKKNKDKKGKRGKFNICQYQLGLEHGFSVKPIIHQVSKVKIVKKGQNLIPISVREFLPKQCYLGEILLISNNSRIQFTAVLIPMICQNS